MVSNWVIHSFSAAKGTDMAGEGDTETHQAKGAIGQLTELIAQRHANDMDMFMHRSELAADSEEMRGIR